MSGQADSPNRRRGSADAASSRQAAPGVGSGPGVGPKVAEQASPSEPLLPSAFHLPPALRPPIPSPWPLAPDRDFSRRSTEREILDDTSLDDREMGRVLDDLRTVNRLLGGYRATVDALERLAPSGPLRLLDVGAGGGDMARELVAWGASRGRQVEVVSVDLSAAAVAYARRHLADVEGASLVRASVFALPFPPASFDVVICALFLHHFTEEEAPRLLAALHDVSRLGVVVNDLHRHRLAHLGFALLSRALGFCEIVRYDGLASVRRAFRREDFEQMARAARLQVDVRWRWAFRYQAIFPKTV